MSRNRTNRLPSCPVRSTVATFGSEQTNSLLQGHCGISYLDSSASYNRLAGGSYISKGTGYVHVHGEYFKVGTLSCHQYPPAFEAVGVQASRQDFLKIIIKMVRSLWLAASLFCHPPCIISFLLVFQAQREMPDSRTCISPPFAGVYKFDTA